MSIRSEALATRLEEGVARLATLAEGLTPAEWATPIPKDGRTVGVVVHHVGNMFPIEMQVALTVAKGDPVEGVTWEAVHAINKEHAAAQARVTKEEAVEFLRTRARSAAQGIRALSDAELDRAAPVSLYGDAPVTCQFMLEDHAVRHCWHHLDKIRRALGR